MIKVISPLRFCSDKSKEQALRIQGCRERKTQTLEADRPELNPQMLLPVAD